MKRLILFCLVLPLIIMTSCATNSSAPSASPSKPSSVPTATASPTKLPIATQTPKVTVKPSPKQSFKLTDEAARAYIKTIRDVLDSQEKLQKIYNWKYDDDEYSGVLYDLDSDGQDELIMAYISDDGKYYSYEIYTYKSGNAVLIKRDKLFNNSGLEGGLNIVNYNGERFLCVWSVDSHSAEIGLYTDYKYTLFTYKGSTLNTMHTFGFVYIHQIPTDKKLPLDGKPGLFKDGKEISFEEFIKTQDELEMPVNILCRVGKSEPPYRLRQLYEDIKNR